MNWFNTILLLSMACLVVWFQATFNEVRSLIGAQVDLLPSLVVYTALRSTLVSLTLVSVLGGLLLDSVSANPLGTSLFPLFIVGLVVQRSREYILRDQTYAQLILGLWASVIVPAMSLLILMNIEKRPLIGWFSFWQWMVVGVTGALFTPVWFCIFDLLGTILNYRPLGESSFRPDREIKRGR